MWLAVAIVVTGLGGYIGLPHVAKIVLRKRFLDRIVKSGFVCVTFDDGPSPDVTPAILDILEEAKAKATFFVVGQAAEQYPEIMERIKVAGHEIGEHSYWHSHAWANGPLLTTKDLIAGGKVVGNYAGADSKTSFRPPYGKLNLATLAYIWFGKKRTVFWNVDPKDYRRSAENETRGGLKDRLREGSVVLLHDGRLDGPGRASNTVEILKSIVKEAAERDLRLVTVCEAIERGRRGN